MTCETKINTKVVKYWKCIIFGKWANVYDKGSLGNVK